MTRKPDGADYSVLDDRMGYLLGLRAAMASITIAWVVLRPETLGLPFATLATATAGYLVVALVTEVTRRRTTRFGHTLLTALLLLDGVYLAAASYATGGTQSPMRFLVYLHLVAVSLLASYRTGLKIALWHSLLLLVVLYAQAAQLVPAVDVIPGRAIEFARMPVLNVTSFWLFALATSLFSAMNERELRQRRADLQALVDIGARLDEVADPIKQARIVLDGVAERFGFERGFLLGASDGNAVVLAGRGTATTSTSAIEPDAIVRRAWERRELLALTEIDPSRNPVTTKALPGVRHVLVSPMVADGRPVGAIVVEHRARRILGVERRVASMLGQIASIAALNLRNAVLLRHVRDLAERDSLTGAANRRMFQVSLEQVLVAAPPKHRPDDVTAVLFIDLDDFKIVNDTLGHAAGDALLVAVTNRIGDLVRDTDLVARLGGDEFAILTDDDRDLQRARSMAQRLVRELRTPYAIAGQQVRVTASIGIASTADPIDGASDLVRNADVAMYMAKANGKAGFAIFDPGMHAAIRERHELGVEVQRAVELSQLRLAFQPIVALDTGRVAGVEALVRWDHPDRGLIQPGEFIEIAEENGAILPIGRWVLTEACREVARWSAESETPTDVFLCVNVSAREIQEHGFVAGVRAALEGPGFPPSRLLLEITETALLKATPTTIATLGELRDLGVRTVIDDFGTGYFSLSHLRQFPVDALKIAGEFVQDAEPDARSSALAAAIVALGASLRIETVAEGIETPEQAERMRSLGCDYGQGFHFSRPVEGEDVRLSLVRTSERLAQAETEALEHVRRRVRGRPVTIATILGPTTA